MYKSSVEEVLTVLSMIWKCKIKNKVYKMGIKVIKKGKKLTKVVKPIRLKRSYKIPKRNNRWLKRERRIDSNTQQVIGVNNSLNPKILKNILEGDQKRNII